MQDTHYADTVPQRLSQKLITTLHLYTTDSLHVCDLSDFERQMNKRKTYVEVQNKKKYEKKNLKLQVISNASAHHVLSIP